jgi:hypothetical protein
VLYSSLTDYRYNRISEQKIFAMPTVKNISGPYRLFFYSFAGKNIEPRIKHIEVSEDTITAYLVDGRTISVPLAWSWRLSDAAPEERNNWELIADGQGVHWPDIDEDISAKGMLYGVPARHPQPALV